METFKWKINNLNKALNSQIIKKKYYKKIFNNICIDSRKIKKGDIFLCINSKKKKGIFYIDEAIKKGSLSIILSKLDLNKIKKKILKKKLFNFIVVKNKLKSLGNIAKYYRKKINIKIIAITGSSGKTTTKEIIRKILSKNYSLVFTEKNMNNLIGLPVTLLRSKNYNQLAILELGMNKIGEIKRLSEISKPDISIVTNINSNHLSNLKNIKNIIKAKSEIFNYIKPNSNVIININNKTIKNIIIKKNIKICFFGNKNADIFTKKCLLKEKKTNFFIKINKKFKKITLNSKIQDDNSLSAIAVSTLLNISKHQIKNIIQTFKGTSQRLKKFKLINNNKILDDSYNSNPSSVKNSISIIKKNISSIIFIIGDMLELGKKSKLIHYKMGKKISQTKFDKIYLTGLFGKYISMGISKNKKNKIFLKKKIK